MKKQILLSIVTVFLTAAFAQETNFSGHLSTMWGIYAPGTKNAGDFSTGTTKLSGTLETFMGNGTALAEGSLAYNCVNKTFEYSIDEAYIDYSTANWGFRIGNQKVAWGKADGVQITNSVLPSNSTSLYLEDDSLAINAARISYTNAAFTIDCYWIPFFRGNALPLEEGNPLRNALIPSNVTMNVMGSAVNLPVTLGTLEEPAVKIENGEYGFKASTYLSYCDLSIYGFYGWDKTPLMKYNLTTQGGLPSGIKINGEYKRIGMIGLDAAFPVKETVIRCETAFFPNRSFQSSTEYFMKTGEVSIKQNQIMALVGIDWMPEEWTITAQYYFDLIVDKSAGIQRENAYTHGSTLSISKSFLQDTLELNLSGIIGFNAFDSAINFSAKYSLSDQIKLTAGTNIFLPGFEKDGNYGVFKDLSSVFIKCQYNF